MSSITCSAVLEAPRPPASRGPRAHLLHIFICNALSLFSSIPNLHSNQLQDYHPTMTRRTDERIARRLKARREALGLTQEELSRQMNINHRQTLAAIEGGQRRIQPEELVLAAQALGVDVDFFTDPYAAAGEAAFSFRAAGGDEVVLSDFELEAGRWIAAFRELGTESGRPTSLLTPSLSVTPRSSYEDAMAAAEDVARKLGLGRIPSTELEVALEREWGILILYVDPPAGISGAASRLHGLQVILVNRNESAGRRHYDIAHELFHLLTWDAMPPARVDSVPPRGRGRRVEQLAENFAAALLMPRSTVLEFWAGRGTTATPEWIAATSAVLGVSASALKWRLVNLGLLTKSKAPADAEIEEALLAVERAGSTPPPYSASFVQRLHAAVESGHLSLRRASRLVSMDAAGFAELCRIYGRQLSYQV